MKASEGSRFPTLGKSIGWTSLRFCSFSGFFFCIIQFKTGEKNKKAGEGQTVYSCCNANDNRHYLVLWILNV